MNKINGKFVALKKKNQTWFVIHPLWFINFLINCQSSEPVGVPSTVTCEIALLRELNDQNVSDV